MKKEIRLRRIQNNKPTDIIRIVPGKGIFIRNMDEEECDFHTFDAYFVCAETGSFDLGIKIENEWWFENDRIKVIGYNLAGVLKYNTNDMRWEIICEDARQSWSYTNLTYMDEFSHTFDRVGTIYDEEK